MADIATPEFLASLAALYPVNTKESALPAYLDSQWYLAAAVAFTSSNLPEAVPLVLKYALRELKEQSASEEECLLVVRKAKDAIFKAGILCGYPKAINALAALRENIPDQYHDTEHLRDITVSTDALNANGQLVFDQLYGDTSKEVQTFLNRISPDFEFFMTTHCYGYVIGAGVLSAYETSFAIIAAVIGNDTPRQAVWHLSGALRNGATVDQTKAVRQIAINVAQAAGVVFKHPIPEVPEAV